MMRRRLHARPRAQLLVIFAIGILVMLAFTGFALDLAQYLIYRAHLRRAVDAAAMAAAGQFRSNYSTITQMKTGMRRAAQETIALNGVEVSDMTIATSIDVDDGGTPLCDDPVQDATQVPDRYLCFPRGRKKVWIRAEAEVPTAFMRLFGVPTFTVEADAVGEAASLDLILALDISVSMAYDGATPAQRDPIECSQHPNDFGAGCLPFEYVRSAAKKFVQQILDLPCTDPTDPTQCLEQDRIAIVLFSTGWENDPAHYRGTFYLTAPGGGPWFKRQSDALAALNNMKLYQPQLSCKEWVDAGLPDEPGVCLCYGSDCLANRDPDQYNGYPDPTKGIQCMLRVKYGYPDGDVSTCTTTNIGGALALSSSVLKQDPRPDALWVTVLLTDGTANATGPSPIQCVTDPGPGCEDLSDPLASLPFGYCPDSTQYNTAADPELAEAWCRDLNTGGSGSRRTDPSAAEFDADDYARFFADFLACPPSPTGPGTPAPSPPSGCATWGQGAFIYAIGMGAQVVDTTTADPGDPPPGAALLRYIAAVGDDNDPTTDLCSRPPYNADYSLDCGNYYYRASGADIAEVFDEIAQRIFTRLSH